MTWERTWTWLFHTAAPPLRKTTAVIIKRGAVGLIYPPSERREYFNFNTYSQTHRECDTEFLLVEFKLTKRTKASAEILTFQLRALKFDSQREATSQRKPSEATGDNAALWALLFLCLYRNNVRIINSNPRVSLQTTVLIFSRVLLGPSSERETRAVGPPEGEVINYTASPTTACCHERVLQLSECTSCKWVFRFLSAAALTMIWNY